jgi:hypothetical protein
MTLFRVAPLAVLAVLGFASEGRAQFATPGQQQGMPPCMAEFAPLRAEAEKRGAAIKAAAQKKVPREQLCQLFRHFIEAETKVVKFLSEHQAACGIPPDAIKASKASHTSTVGMQQKICAADSAEGNKPRGPGIGEALGVRAIPTPETTKTGKGIFDTLSGTQLAQ